jgi:hypothetical protein
MFGVVTITSPLNIDIVEYVNYMLSPSMDSKFCQRLSLARLTFLVLGGMGSDRKNKRQAELLEMYETILIHQSSYVLRDESGNVFYFFIFNTYNF